MCTWVLVTLGAQECAYDVNKTLMQNVIGGVDVDANTGGYNLQAAFSTGWIAGQSAAKATINP